jgi:hypothetical protein
MGNYIDEYYLDYVNSFEHKINKELLFGLIFFMFMFCMLYYVGSLEGMLTFFVLVWFCCFVEISSGFAFPRYIVLRIYLHVYRWVL